MSVTARTWIMYIVTVLSVAADENCGEVQEGKETGMVRLPDFSSEIVENLTCYWAYTAPLDRKLLIKVDNVHLPPSELRNSSLQLYVDDQYFEIPRNCVKCLREMVGGKTVKIIFSSSVNPSVAHSVLQNTTYTTDSVILPEGIGSFQIRFKAFDPHRCSRPKSPENGYVVGKDRKLGQEIIYNCNPPYDMIGSSKANCIIPENTPVPEWSYKPPRCIIKDCSKGPIHRDAGSGAIANPGYPSYIFQSTSPCFWEITAHLEQQITVSVTYLVLTINEGKSGSSSYLSLFDNDQKNLVANLTDTLGGEPLNFTTRSNKLIVKFVVGENNKTKEDAGFYLEYSTIPSSCPDPGPPSNGELVAYSRELGSTVAYRCFLGYVLVGEPHADCLPNGQWSNPKPTCELLTVHSETFLTASNDTDTVSGNITELTLLPSPSKRPIHSKKKAKETQVLKLSKKPSVERKDKAVVPKDDFSSVEPLPEAVSVDVSSREKKKNDKDDGPKSQPHLQQVIPPKDSVKKATEPRDRLPGPGTGSNVTSRLPSPPVGQETREGKGRRGLSVTLIAIIAGVGAPFGVGLVLLLALLIYRKRYPVRMRFGRKFSTFENPMYVRKDAHHPRELKPLTT